MIGADVMNRYIKDNYDVRKDAMDWALLKSSALFKIEYKKKQSEMEIIDSYIEGMNAMCEKIKKDFRIGMYVVKTYSLCIPYLFMCRHTIELILKKSIENKISDTKKGHDNLKLWNECKNLYADKDLSYYDELIDTINMLDNNGEKFRYSKDKNGIDFNNNPQFLNVELLNKDINNLKKELL